MKKLDMKIIPQGHKFRLSRQAAQLSFILSTIAILSLQVTLAIGATLELTPNVVEISTFYNGTTVTVNGEVPATAEAVIRVSSEGEELHLKKKGKVGGVLWMNTGDITLEHAPKIYMSYTPAAITDINASGANDFGLEALKNRISVAPAAEDKNFIIGEFIKLKEEDGLYAVNPATVTYGPTAQGMKPFTATLTIPPRMSQGEYRVDLAVVQGGSMTSISKSLEVKQVGFPAQLSKLAFDSPLLHGVLAVLVALGAGLFIGTIFKDKGGAH